MIGNLDTICALATPNGIGAIGMIRLSGKESLAIASKVFSKSLESAASHTTHFGIIKNDKGDLIDEVLITVFEEGKSFTGEQSAEISCHGSPYIQQQITNKYSRRSYSSSYASLALPYLYEVCK